MSEKIMSKPALVLRLGFVQSEERLKTPFLHAKYGDKRRFYSCNQDFNYVSYVNQGSKQKIDYIAYSGNNEKSAGVLGKTGLMTFQEQAELKKRLRETKSVIWHGVIAFEQEFGKKYMNGYDDALRLMNAELPKLLKNAGLNPDNITWYAGLHENTKNKHVHVSFFENAPSRYTERGGMVKRYSEGHIAQPVIDRFKLAVQQHLTDVAAELKLARKNLTDLTREVLFSEKNRKGNLTEVQEHITDLIKLLPAEGRLSFDSGNMKPLRPRIKRVVDLLIKSEPRLYNAFTDLCDAAMKKDGQTREMLISQKIGEKYWPSYMTTGKVLEDAYRRLGNYVINTARNFREKEKPGPGRRPVTSRLVRKRIKKQTETAALTYCLGLSAKFEQEAMDAFNEYMRKLKVSATQAEEENEIGVMEKDENEMV